MDTYTSNFSAISEWRWPLLPWWQETLSWYCAVDLRLKFQRACRVGQRALGCSLQGFSLLHEFHLASSNAAKTISNVIDIENRKGANFVYDLDTREYSMTQLPQVRQHTSILVNDQSPCWLRFLNQQTSQQHRLQKQNDAERNVTCSVLPPSPWYVDPRYSDQCHSSTIVFEEEINITAIMIAYLDDQPQLQSLNWIIKFHLKVYWGPMSKSGEIEVKIPSRFVPVLEDKCFCKLSNFILALGIDPSSEPVSIFIFCRREYFLHISIFSSLPSASMLRHMSMYDCSSTIPQLTTRFGWASNAVHPWCLCPIFFQGEHWRCQSIWQSTSVEIHRSFQWVLNVNLVPDLLSRSNKIALTDNLDGLYRKKFDLICHYFDYWRERAIRECGMLSHEEQSCDTGMIEAAIIVPKIELGGNSIQTAKRGSTGTKNLLNWGVVLVATLYRPIIMAAKSSKTSMMRFALQDHMTMSYISLLT